MERINVKSRAQDLIAKSAALDLVMDTHTESGKKVAEINDGLRELVHELLEIAEEQDRAMESLRKQRDKMDEKCDRQYERIVQLQAELGTRRGQKTDGMADCLPD